MSSKEQETKLVIITGMSGAGKTVAVQSFEDLGFYCVDNLPPALLPKFLELMRDATNTIQKVALVMDLRGREFFDTLFEALDKLGDQDWLEEHILFLDAKDESLVSRYKETRRSHPLAVEGLPMEGIQLERQMLDELRGRAQNIIDTTDLKPKELRDKIVDMYAERDQAFFSVQIVSFGFKYGLPIDSDLVFDVRFLPNPHYVENMRPLTGKNDEVAKYVFKWSDTQKFVEKISDLLQFMLPQYKREGKSQLVIAIGCTGGQHRSVAIAEYLSKQFSANYVTHVSHRDIDKRKGH
ncbi:RNase adapter RapZ [Aquibacillus sp. 3ASR75-11]|uniref:RNase adapter RapZ n=1 Tax=Terrihalobacillus insolitus TaxID=2950438 RepID=A0A9X4AM10_9BACI|nr:RNase adapter RapZ [Terrihalobacillus insolitus]MDC3412269.1 RNase adapter RapZ [Terrihalobacillus insolitus]MDC3423038.1 RNase adapter RapZ [Terrihalobacillus insolitus]